MMRSAHFDNDLSIGLQAKRGELEPVVIVSPYFPPAALAGVHRGRHLLKYLPAHGWRPTVVCVHERHYEQTLDPSLKALVPADADIRRVDAISLRVTRPFGIGEISLRGYASIRSAVIGAVEARPGQVVLITGSPFYPMLLSSEIRQRGGRVVLDFQDPWVSRWGSAQPRLSKAGLSHRLAAWFEPRVVRHADFITAVSDEQNREMQGRYPDLDPTLFAAIPIGGDPDDFAILRGQNGADADNILAAGFINLSFVGTFMPRSEPLMRLLLRGAKVFRTAHPDLAAKVRFNFIGTGNHSGATRNRVLEIASEVGLKGGIFELPQRIAFTRALGTLAKSDGVLLIGSDEPHYTASKIYPALMSGRPFLSLFHSASSSHRILKNAGGGEALAYDPTEDSTAAVERIARALLRLVAEPASFGRSDPNSYGPYTAHAIAGRYAQIFDRVSRCA